MNKNKQKNQDDTIPHPGAMVFSRPNHVSPNALPRCLDCGYVLEGLDRKRCPECGRDFDPALASTLIWKPPFLRWRYWLPGLVLAGVGGLGWMCLFVGSNAYGYGLTVAVPFSVGALLGYGVRIKKFLLIILALCLIGALCFGLITFNYAGFFCGLILAGIFIGPLFLGVFSGWLLRILLKITSFFDQRAYLPLIFFLLLPGLVGTLETWIGWEPQVEKVVTQRLIPFSSQQAWACWMFYEEVKHDPPWAAHLGLPHPLNSRGKIQGVGDIKVCVYTKGRLVKRIIQYQPEKFLKFSVIEQTGVEDRSIGLISGSFRFQTVGPNATLVQLTTEYEPRLSARLWWRPLEHHFAHLLHQHVLKGIELEIVDRFKIACAQEQNR